MTIVHSKQTPQKFDEVEKLLLILINEKELDEDSINDGVICEKALRIYADLQKETLSMSAEGESWFTFKTSSSWVNKCKHRSGIHCVARHGEATCSNW